MWRSEVNLQSSHDLFSTLFIEARFFGLNSELADLASLARQLAPGPLLSLPPVCWDYGQPAKIAWHLHGCCGSKLQPPPSSGRAPSCLSHLPSPIFMCLSEHFLPLDSMLRSMVEHLPVAASDQHTDTGDTV